MKTRKLGEEKQKSKQHSPPRDYLNQSTQHFLKSTRIKRQEAGDIADLNQINKMINREDLNISSTMTKRATNLDRLKDLESLLDKEVTDAEINL